MRKSCYASVQSSLVCFRETIELHHEHVCLVHAHVQNQSCPKGCCSVASDLCSPAIRAGGCEMPNFGQGSGAGYGCDCDCGVGHGCGGD